MSGPPLSAATAKVLAMAMNATPPARPSSPSMRFIAFITPAIQSMVKGRARNPSSITPPRGFAMWSMRNPNQYMSAATPNWTANLMAAPLPRRSS